MDSVPLVTPEAVCRREGLSPAACVARDKAENAQREMSAKICTQLFPHQSVLQSACTSSCSSNASTDGQDCAFNYSRSLHYAADTKTDTHLGIGSVALIGIVMCALGFAMVKGYKRIQELGYFVRRPAASNTAQ
jgi:hypothetical protein